MTLSANNSQSGTGILWVLNGQGGSSSTNDTRSLYALNAEHIDTGPLWSSDGNTIDNAGPGSGFGPPPTVYNGRVYVGGGTTANGVAKGNVHAYRQGPLYDIIYCPLCSYYQPYGPTFHVHSNVVAGPIFHIGPWWGVGVDESLYIRTEQNGSWPVFASLTAKNFAPTGASIAVAQQTASQTDAFIVGNDGKIYMTSQTNGGSWQALTALTPANLAPPGARLATATQAGQLEVAVIDTVGKLQILSWNSLSGWVGPVAVTAANYAPPGAGVIMGTRASGELDTFSIGSDGALKYMAYYGGGWSGPWPLSAANFAPPGAPVATAVDVHGYLNVFTVANDGALYTKWDCTPLWCGATALTATGYAPPGANLSAINFNNKSINAFLVDNLGTLEAFSNAGFSWQGPTAVAANIAQPGAATDVAIESSTQLDLFALSTTALSGMVESINTGGGWSAPVALP